MTAESHIVHIDNPADLKPGDVIVSLWRDDGEGVLDIEVRRAGPEPWCNHNLAAIGPDGVCECGVRP